MAVQTAKIQNLGGSQILYNDLRKRAASADGNLADEYSASKTYAVGDFVMHLDKLYRCKTAITTAEAWTAAHWEETSMGEETSGLKSALDNVSGTIGLVPTYDFVPGYYANAVVGATPTWNIITGSSITRLSTPPDKVFVANEAYQIIIPSGYKAIFFKLDSNDAFIELIGWITGSTVLDGGYHYYITYAKSNEGQVDNSDLIGFETIPASTAFSMNAHVAGDNVNILGACRWVRGNVKNNSSTNTPYIDYTVTTRICVIDYIEPSTDVELYVDNGYKYYLFGIAPDGTTASVSGWQTGRMKLTTGSKYMLIVANTSDSVITVPEYKHLHVTEGTFDPYKATTDAVISAALSDKDSKTLTFALITDTHNDTNAARQTEVQGAKIGEFADRVGAAFTIHLGDVIQGTNATLATNKATLAEFWGEMHKQHTPILYTIAHHEMYGAQGASGWGNDPTACTASDCMGMYGTDTAKWLDVHYSADGLSWYCDIDGIRCIGLDSASNGPYGYSMDVISFAETALNTDKKVILFAHVAPYGGVMTNGDAPTNGADLVTIINANASKIIAFFHGHTHWDNYYKPSGGVMYVSTCCALPEKVSTSLYCPDGTPTAYTRTLGTLSEYCMDIVNIHVDTGKIKTFRFGAGTDRTITY